MPDKFVVNIKQLCKKLNFNLYAAKSNSLYLHLHGLYSHQHLNLPVHFYSHRSDHLDNSVTGLSKPVTGG
jgi:hypothetical protein